MIKSWMKKLGARVAPAAEPSFGAGFERLEDRLMLSGTSLLGVTVDYPLISFDSGGSMSYDAPTQTFQAHGTPFAFRLNGSTPPVSIIAPAGVQFSFKVDNAGNLLGGVPGDDLVITGGVDANGNGVIDPGEYSGTLLTGEIAALGALDSGTTDQYDFRFTATGGALVTAGLFAGKDIGIIANSLGSTFTGDWSVNFGGSVEGKVGPTTQPVTGIPKIDIEKYVKDMGSPEGLSDCFWTKCGNAKYWTGFKAGDKYEQVFNVDVPSKDPTLGQALQSGGYSGLNALLRESTAALLNAANPNVNYIYSVDQVKQMVQQAFATGKYDACSSLFEKQNGLGGSLAGGPASGYGSDADTAATALSVKVGHVVQFTYVVVNTGNVPLSNVVVVDDNATPLKTSDDFSPAPVLAGAFNVGDLNQDGKLDPGETWLYTFRKVITCAGSFVNTATVVGSELDKNGNLITKVTDSDPANLKAVKDSCYNPCYNPCDTKYDDHDNKCGGGRDYYYQHQDFCGGHFVKGFDCGSWDFGFRC